MSDLNVSATPTPAAAPTPAASPAPAAIPQFTPPVAATPATPQVPATGTSEDRSNWVPPHRLRETTTRYENAQRQWAEREAQYQAMLEQNQNQLRALVGVAPPPDPEVDAIRQRFGQIYPGLNRLETQAEEFERFSNRMEELETAVKYIWQNHGRQSLDRIYKHAEDTLGSPLTDDGRRALHAAFAGWVQSSPEYQERYIDDPTIVDEFWKTLSSTLVDPARRATQAAAAGRVPGALPQDTPAGAPPATPPAPKPANLDERARLAFQMFQAERNR